MAEYIDREALFKRLNEEKIPFNADINSLIKYAPTIDAVPVIRCRECFGRNCWEKDENGCDICWVSGLYVRGEDDYCPYGERKESDD